MMPSSLLVNFVQPLIHDRLTALADREGEGIVEHVVLCDGSADRSG